MMILIAPIPCVYSEFSFAYLLISVNSMGSGSKAFMAYVAEGLGNLLDWDQAMEHQRKNGSLFNSPATTAAAAIHNYNGRALDYLDSLISRFGSSGVQCRTERVLYSYPRNQRMAKLIKDIELMAICSADCVSAERVLPASHGGHVGEDGDLCELFR